MNTLIRLRSFRQAQYKHYKCGFATFFFARTLAIYLFFIPNIIILTPILEVWYGRVVIKKTL